LAAAPAAAQSAAPAVSLAAAQSAALAAAPAAAQAAAAAAATAVPLAAAQAAAAASAAARRETLTSPSIDQSVNGPCASIRAAAASRPATRNHDGTYDRNSQSAAINARCWSSFSRWRASSQQPPYRSHTQSATTLLLKPVLRCGHLLDPPVGGGDGRGADGRATGVGSTLPARFRVRIPGSGVLEVFE